MALPASGQISLSQIGGEFDDTQPNQLNEFYRNGGKVPGHEGINANIPTSGTISFSDFYSGFDELLVTLSNTTNVNCETAFGTSDYQGSKRKRIIIPAGVTVGGVGTDALTIPSGMGGQLIITNRGAIHGFGGAAGGGDGGNAINCQQNGNVTVENHGDVFAKINHHKQIGTYLKERLIWKILI